MTVLFDGSPVTPENLTPTFFDFTVPVAASGTKDLVVTLPNGQSASGSVFVQRIVPTIDGITEQSFPSGLTRIDVTGTNFDASMTVLFDGSPVTPEDLTLTSFGFTVLVATSGMKDLVVTLPNGESASGSVFVQRIVPSIASVFPETIDVGGLLAVTGTNFDPTMTVDFEGVVLAPTGVTSTSFDVVMDGVPLGSGQLTATLVNGESDSIGLTVVEDFRRIFLATTPSGNLGGAVGADALCAAAASGLGIPGTYLAWLSDAGTDPASRFTQTGGPFVNLSFEKIADDWADLTDGTLDAPIAPSGVVWSNTAPDGTYASGVPDCLGWTTDASSETGSRAFPFSTTGSWTNPSSPIGCDSGAFIYCFEQ